MSTVVQPETIDHLDFTPEVPCEATIDEPCEYDNAANYIVAELPCPECGETGRGRYPVCHECWVDMTQRGLLECDVCYAMDETGQSIRIVEVLR